MGGGLGGRDRMGSDQPSELIRVFSSFLGDQAAEPVLTTRCTRRIRSVPRSYQRPGPLTDTTASTPPFRPACRSTTEAPMENPTVAIRW